MTEKRKDERKEGRRGSEEEEKKKGMDQMIIVCYIVHTDKIKEGVYLGCQNCFKTL